jgi:hypothetical protein
LAEEVGIDYDEEEKVEEDREQVAEDPPVDILPNEQRTIFLENANQLLTQAITDPAIANLLKQYVPSTIRRAIKKAQTDPNLSGKERLDFLIRKLESQQGIDHAKLRRQLNFTAAERQSWATAPPYDPRNARHPVF